MKSVALFLPDENPLIDVLPFFDFVPGFQVCRNVDIRRVDVFFLQALNQLVHVIFRIETGVRSFPFAQQGLPFLRSG